MNSKTDIKVHPIEDVLNMQPEVFKQNINTVIEHQEVPTYENIEQCNNTEKDEEDIKLDTQIDAVYNTAMDAFKDQMEYVQEIEPRYAARNAEVAAQYLNIALNSRIARARVKKERTNNKFVPYANQGSGPRTVNNNVIVADRNAILKMLLDNSENKQEI